MYKLLNSTAGLCEWLLQVNLQFSLLVILVGVTTFCLRRVLAAHWRSLLWLLVFSRLALPFGPASRFSAQNLWLSSTASSARPVALEASVGELRSIELPANLERLPSNAPIAGSTQVPIEQESLTFLTLPHVLLVAWSAVAVILLLRLLWRSVALSRTLRGLARIDDPSLVSLTEQCAREVGLRRVPAVVAAPVSRGPAVGGWFRPVLLLPPGCVSRLSGEQLRLVILHELRHVRTGDLLVGWLLHVVVSLHWFNPLVWLAQRCWIAEREMACDGWVLAHAGREQRRCYGETLVCVIESVGRPQPLTMTAGMVAFPSLIERRIQAMKCPAPHPLPSLVCGSLAAILLGLFGLTDRIQAQQAKPEQAAALTDIRQVAAAQKDDQKPQPQRVKLTFAKQVLLWGSKEIVTWDEALERLETRQQKGPVTVRLFFTQGWALKSPDDLNERMKEIVDAAPKGSGMTFVSLRGSERLDKVENADDLVPDPALRRTGRVLLPDAAAPAAQAQIVIIPAVGGCDLYLRGTKLRDPEDELWTTVGADGNFAIHPDVDDYSVAIVHESGFGFFSGPIDPNGARYQLKPWAKVTITSTAPEDELTEIWVRPAGSDKISCGVSLSSVRSKGQAVTRKVPPGRVHVSQIVNMNDGTYFLAHKQPLFRLAAGESKSFALDPLNEFQRAEVKKRHEEQRAALENQR